MALIDRETRSLLARNKTFRSVWAGEAFANFGMQLTTFALPLIAISTVHASGVGVGFVSFAQFLPVLLFSLVAGVMVDRYPPRHTLILGSVVRGTALAGLGLAAATGQVTLLELGLATGVVGTANVFYEVAYQSTVPKIVPTDSIAAANGLQQAFYSVSELAGPSAAGFLLGRFGLSAPLTVAVVLFVGAVVSGALLRGVGAAGAVREPVLRSIRTGLRYTWSLRPIRDLCVQAGLANLLSQAFMTVFLLQAVRELGLGSGTVGVILGIGSLGSVAGSLYAARLSARLTVGRTLLAGVTLLALGLLGVATAVAVGRYVPVLASLGFMVMGLGTSLFNVYAVSLRQSIPQQHQLGAVTASYRMVALGTLPVGGLLGGSLVDALSPGTAAWVIGCSFLAAPLWLLTSPLRTVRTLEEAKLLGSNSQDRTPGSDHENPMLRQAA